MVGLACISLSLMDVLNAIKSMSWPSTIGYVTDVRKVIAGESSGTDSSSGGPIYVYEKTISYEIHGQLYQESIQESSIDSRPLNIYYDPKRPADTRLRTNHPSIVSILLFVGGIAVIVLDIVGHTSLEKKGQLTKTRERADLESPDEEGDDPSDIA
jgi:hypothetical protein